jgi:hypothetical protein
MNPKQLSEAVETVGVLMNHLEAGDMDLARTLMADEGEGFKFDKPEGLIQPEFKQAYAEGESVVVPTVVNMDGERGDFTWVCIHGDEGWKIDMALSLTKTTGDDVGQMMDGLQEAMGNVVGAMAEGMQKVFESVGEALGGRLSEEVDQDAAGQSEDEDNTEKEPVDEVALTEYEEHFPRIKKDVWEMGMLMRASTKLEFELEADWDSARPCLEPTVILFHGMDQICAVLTMTANEDKAKLQKFKAIHLAFDKKVDGVTWSMADGEARGVAGAVPRDQIKDHAKAIAEGFSELVG